ncbi:HD domain-containing protein [Vibrio sp. JC009]|uniref:HD-GYP domain-containing protein n=1 Tax=Vibrio sp. JC009 TaxID=2912314 RepID=UPI0023B1ADF8|nr:HD domain-containing phosphohydrolase [Vibrio sp. JC009]WED23983.1 HD domain-containing protein [Vibrio sp. JC009]
MDKVVSGIEIDLRHALLMIARALDYVGIDDINHGHRVAYMAYECAKKLGWDEDKAKFAYYTGLIHDCGVSSTDEHAKLVGKLEPEDVKAHCIRGYEELIKCPPLARFAVPVLYHHTQWCELDDVEISDFDREISAIVYLADRLDFLRAYYIQDLHQEAITLHKELISEHVTGQASTMFDPEMVKAMNELIFTDGFWYNMDTSYIEIQAISGAAGEEYSKQLDLNDVIQLARFLARIVDAKSPFTFEHSEKVALISQMLAEELDFDEEQQTLIYVAGLMHDIGKLRTPDDILNKGHKLSREEYSRIRRHTVDTEHVLRSFFPNSDIGKWAANHHELLDGSGYPYKKTGAELDLPSRIIAIADMFQALAQKRPYRLSRLSAQEITARMAPLAEEGKIDSQIFAVIQNNLSRYYQAAISDDKPEKIYEV